MHNLASVQFDVDLDHRVGLGVVDSAHRVRAFETPDVARILEVVNGGGRVSTLAGPPSCDPRPRAQVSTESPAVRQACMPPSRLKTCCMPSAAAISAATALRWPTSHTNTTLSEVIAS
jgi:hypothetical protein